MSVAVIVVGSLLIWVGMVAGPVALLIGRGIRLADQRTPLIPPAGEAVGEAPRARRGHLHAV